jgi:sterol desaturase/sphingolipid hydroxylase (fatty acid hydroxylase superfamily)
MKAAASTLERLCASKVNYWLSFALDAATVVITTAAGISMTHETGHAFLTFAAGVLIFTFIEYGMHRWLFHARASFATASHQNHHFSPHRPTAMPFICGPLGAVLIWQLTTTLIGTESGTLLTAGIMCTYLYYGVLHDLQHRIRVKGWMKMRWRDHALHHSTHNRNYGVTTSLWDRVFGTYCNERQIRVQRHSAC